MKVLKPNIYTRCGVIEELLCSEINYNTKLRIIDEELSTPLELSTVISPIHYKRVFGEVSKFNFVLYTFKIPQKIRFPF